jgi:hypothetical protein
MATLSHGYAISLAALLNAAVPETPPAVIDLYQHELTAYLDRAAPEAHPAIADLYQKWRTDRRSALSRAQCMEGAGWGLSTQIEKEKRGDLVSILDGKKRLIPTSSFYPHLIDRVITAYPAGARVRRKPTPQELAGLARANEQRKREGAARRAEKVRHAQEAAAASA